MYAVDERYPLERVVRHVDFVLTYRDVEGRR